MAALVTFIIPTINRPTLQRSVESLFAQTNPNWEAIIVYDGMPAINNFNDTRIKCISIPKCGQLVGGHGAAGEVRNAGIKIATTPYIGLLDDDDTLGNQYVNQINTQYDINIFRMLGDDGIIPRLSNASLVPGNIGISYCFANKGDILFDGNSFTEDHAHIHKLISKGFTHIVHSQVQYFVKAKRTF